MSKIFTPTNQMRLTNVAVVRMKKAGKRFEIACYKNKVLAWRQQLEKDIDEVLQTHTVFVNVSRGQAAQRDQLVAAFATDDATAICRHILDKGELQVSERERRAQLETSARDIATLVADMCVNPQTGRPYPVTMIEKAMKQVHYSLRPHRSSKQQALELIKLLPTALPLERAQMRLLVAFPAHGHAQLRQRLRQLNSSSSSAAAASSAAGGVVVESDTVDAGSGEVRLVVLLDPGQYRAVDQLVRAETHGSGRVELLALKHVVDSEQLEQ